MGEPGPVRVVSNTKNQQPNFVYCQCKKLRENKCIHFWNNVTRKACVLGLLEKK